MVRRLNLETERLALRPIALDDVDLLVDLDSDPEVMRHLTGGRPTTPAEAEATIHTVVGSRWIATERSTGEFVGWFALDASGDDEFELGYRLRRRSWGQGLAAEGSRALVALAFDQRGAQRVWAQTMAVIERSRHVMERCGLHYVRTFHLDWDDPIDGTEHGEVEYELRRADWDAATRADR